MIYNADHLPNRILNRGLLSPETSYEQLRVDRFNAIGRASNPLSEIWIRLKYWVKGIWIKASGR